MPRKPTHAGINRVKNVHKAFRSHGGMNHLICCKTSTAFKEGERLMAGQGWQRSKARREKLEAMMNAPASGKKTEKAAE